VKWTVALAVDAFASIEPEVGRFLSSEAVDSHAAYVSTLVVEEIVRNLIEHTPPFAHDETATVTITVDAHRVTVVIEDRRPPFDPFAAPPFDIAAPLEQRRAGGMGLHLVRTMTDELTYEAGDDHNRLTAVISRR
jgi:serine/threonine-protein kinase RsbW